MNKNLLIVIAGGLPLIIFSILIIIDVAGVRKSNDLEQYNTEYYHFDVQISNEINDKNLEMNEDLELQTYDMLGLNYLHNYKYNLHFINETENLVSKTKYKDIIVSGFYYKLNDNVVDIYIYVNQDFEDTDFIREINVTYIQSLYSVNEYIRSLNENTKPDYETVLQLGFEKYKELVEQGTFLIKE